MVLVLANCVGFNVVWLTCGAFGVLVGLTHVRSELADDKALCSEAVIVRSSWHCQVRLG